jgi:rRNA processing protein Krr1/Pno1
MFHEIYSNGFQSCYLMLPVPAHMVGYIVGKKGDHIRHIMDTSATEISIENASSSSTNASRMAIIVGLPEGVQLARTLIEKKLYEGRLILRVRLWN